MNLEPCPNQPPDDRPTPIPDAAIEPPPPQLSDDLDGDDLDGDDLDGDDLDGDDLDGDDLDGEDDLSGELDADSASRFVTLMLNTPGTSSDRDFKLSPKSSLKYVQGVVQGQQAYLITNLRGESQTLFQPQMVWTIGRNRDAALPLAERSLSRRHAVILFIQDQGFQLIDLNSMNGSFVNEEPVRQRSPLQDGDYVRLGSVEFIFLTSRSYRTIDFVHPEVLARFTAPQRGAGEFFDYAEP